MNLTENKDIDFSGANIAFLTDDSILVILRDDSVNIPFPNMWDLPGGGRENNETPFECLKREAFEELNIMISEEDIVWSRFYDGTANPDKVSFFAVSRIDEDQLDNIRLGDEGQCYRLMSIEEFLNNPAVIPSLSNRLMDYMMDR